MKDKDAITEIPSTQAKFISRLFTVPKHSGGKRPVINLAPLNNHIYNQPFKMEGLENLRYLLNPGDYFVKIDLSDAYLSIPVHEDSQPYLPFIFDQVTYAFKSMPFGLNVAPARFTSLQTSFGRSKGTVYSSSHMARQYPSNLKFLFKLHSRSRHCYGPTSEPRFSVKHGKVSPHSNSESHLPRYGDRFVNHDFFSSRREGFRNCSKGNNKTQESGISKGNLQVYRNVLGYSPCSKGSSNSLSAASTPSDNLTERKFTFKKPVLLSKIHASPPCPARSGLVDTSYFHFNFKSNHSSTSRLFYSDRRFRPGVGRLPKSNSSSADRQKRNFKLAAWPVSGNPSDSIKFLKGCPKRNVGQEPTFPAHKQKGIDGNFSQSKVFPKIPGECPCSNNER